MKIIKLSNKYINRVIGKPIIKSYKKFSSYGYKQEKAKSYYDKPQWQKNMTNLDGSLKDYYQILGLQPNTTSIEIQKAYYTLNKSLHPDSNITKNKHNIDPKVALSKLNEAHEAYAVLRSRNRRAYYDSERKRMAMMKSEDIDELIGDINGWVSKADKDEQRQRMNAAFTRYRRQQQDPNSFVQLGFKSEFVMKKYSMESVLQNLETNDAKKRRENVLDYNKWSNRVRNKSNDFKKNGVNGLNNENIKEINENLNNLKKENYYRNNVYKTRQEYYENRNNIYNENFGDFKSNNIDDDNIKDEYKLRVKTGPTFEDVNPDTKTEDFYQFIYEKVDPINKNINEMKKNKNKISTWDDMSNDDIDIPIKKDNITINYIKPTQNIFNPGNKIFDDIKGWQENPQNYLNKIKYENYLEKQKKDDLRLKRYKAIPGKVDNTINNETTYTKNDANINNINTNINNDNKIKIGTIWEEKVSRDGTQTRNFQSQMEYRGYYDHIGPFKNADKLFNFKNDSKHGYANSSDFGINVAIGHIVILCGVGFCALSITTAKK